MMKRLIRLTVAFITCASLILFGILTVRPASANTACVQLLSPTTGDVLTVDATTGTAKLDARTSFPATLSDAAYRAVLSPDHNFVLNVTNVSAAGPDAFQLWLGRRSTNVQRALTPQTHAHQYVWSPDSQNLAFMEMRGMNAQVMLFNLAIANASGQRIRREIIPESLDDNWFYGAREVLWSPDAATVALSLYHTALGATLVLRPATAAASIFVSFRSQQITYFTWSPDSQYVLVFTQNATATQHLLYLVQPDGHIFAQTALDAAFEPFQVMTTISVPILRWSPDGQYFYLLGVTDNGLLQLDLFSRRADHLLPAPLPISEKSLNLSVWADQPHTLLFFQRDAVTMQLSLFSLDAATQQITTLMTKLSQFITVLPSPDEATMLLYERRDATHGLLHLVTRDLSTHETPFDDIESRTDLLPMWSSDSHSFLFVTSDATKFNVVWRDNTNGAINSFAVARSATITPNDQFYASWLTNDVILATNATDAGSTFLLIDAHTAHMLPQFSTPIPSNYGYTVVWNDDRYAAISTNTNMLLYRLTDGSIAFDHLAPGAGPGAGTVTFRIEPNERALLLYRDRDSNFQRPTLNLIANNLRRTVMNADFVTLPAWSPDGELFAFAAIEKFKAGWTLKIMSRDGSLLRSFLLPTSTSTTPYQQVRWTNCE